ncbi:MAG: hypothetical protein ABTQ27_00140 [Amaricoccus sp.]|uniref:hypothetical protein n=1 Tax=Amaricoccus sp. TaxID=1872485 RepID=UPI0033146286
MRIASGLPGLILGIGLIVESSVTALAAEASRATDFGHGTTGEAAPAGGEAEALDVAAPESDAGTLPLVSVDTNFELQFDDTFSTSEADAAYRSLYATIEPEITVNASENFRLFAHMVFEPVLDPPSQTTSYFRDEGLYFEELNAQGTFGALNVAAGLVDPAFGIASDEAPGLYGGDFASNYDYLGAAGVTADWTLSSRDSAAGTVEQVIQASLFNADRTALSKSLFTNRGQTRLSDGGVGNTQGPRSFSLAYTYTTLDSSDEIAGPTARLAVRRLAAGEGDANDELGLVAAAETVYPLSDDRAVVPIAEVAYFVNEGGGSDNAISTTLGAEFDQGPWALSLTGALHDTQASGTPTDYMVTASVGHDFDVALAGEYQVSLGYSYAREEGITGNTVGVLLTKNFSWQR